MTRFQVKAALDNAFYFFSFLTRNRLPSGPLTDKQAQTVRRNLLRSHWPLPSSGYPLRFKYRAWQISRIDDFFERSRAEFDLMDEVAAHKLGLKT